MFDSTGKRRAVTGDLHAAGELLQSRLELAAPRRALGGGANRPRRGLRPDARVEPAAAVVAALRIRIVEIVQDARDLHALVLVQLVLEHAERALTCS